LIRFSVSIPGLRVPASVFLSMLPLFATASDTVRWFDREVLKRIDVTGQRVLGFHYHDVRGDEEAFRSLTYFGRGGDTFSDRGQMTVTGRKVMGVLNFQMSLADDRYADPQARRISIDYERRGLTANVGDIRGSLLNTNPLTPFNKSLKGVQMGYTLGRFQAKGIHSESRNSSQTVSLQGNGSTGPYYLRSGQIIDGSIEVRVDGRTLEFGRDYTINYQVGSITFVADPIPQTSTILVTYESFGVNAAGGTVQGVGASYDLGRYGRIGVTTLEQRAGGQRGLDRRTELFQGYGAPATPYTLQFEPLMSPGQQPQVKVDGILQIETIDYFFDAGTSSILYFRRFIPSTSTVEVVYIPRPTQSLDGDRRVLGLDYSIPLGSGDNQGKITLSQATGSLSNDVSPLKGTARAVHANYRTGNLSFNGAYRDIPTGFVSVESRGFNRNERAMDLGAEYNFGRYQYGTSYNNSSVANRRTSSTGAITFDRFRTTATRGFVSLRESEGARWSLDHVRATNLATGGETRLDTTTLSTDRRLGRLNARLGLERVDGYGPLASSTGTVWSNVALNTLRLSGDYSIGTAWALSGRASVSDIRAGEERRTGNDFTLSASYRPEGPWFVDATAAVSKAGELAALSGFQSGFGLGYTGSGFSGVPSSGFNAGATDYRLFRTGATYRASSRLNLEGRFFNSRSEGNVGANTDTAGFGVAALWDVGRSNVLSVALDQTRTQFIGSLGGSEGLSNLRTDSTTFDAFVAGSPRGPWSYRLGTSLLLSGGTTFAQDSIAFEGFLRHNLNPRSNLSMQFRSGQTKGYLPQSDHYLALAYEHQLYMNVSLIGSYKLRNLRNLSGLETQGAYRSSGFDVELSFNFFRF
jgi:hypothetical protein